MRKPLIYFVFAGLGALVVALLVDSALATRDARIAALSRARAPVVVAARDLAPGTVIAARDLKTLSWSAARIPAGSSSVPGLLLGRTVAAPVTKGQPILDAALRPRQSRATDALAIPKGMRAIAIAVDEVADVAGFVLPHARVDVLLLNDGGGGAAANPRAKIVAENVEVAAIGQTISQGTDSPRVSRVVTLLVSPRQAELIANASQMGTLRLAIRNYADHQVVDTAGADASDVWNADGLAQRVLASRPRRAHHSAPRVAQMVIIRDGHDRQLVKFVRARPPQPGIPPTAADPPGQLAARPSASNEGGNR